MHRRKKGQALKTWKNESIFQRLARPITVLLWAIYDVLAAIISFLFRWMPDSWKHNLAAPIRLLQALLTLFPPANFLWAGILSALVLEKAIWVSQDPLFPSTTRGFFSFSHDGLALAIGCFFLTASGFINSGGRRLLVRLPAVLIALAMTADLAVRKTFAFRLNWDDLLPYLNLGALIELAGAEWGIVLLILVLAGFGVIGLTMKQSGIASAYMGGIGVLALLTFALSPNKNTDIYSWQWQNVLLYNISRGVDTPLKDYQRPQRAPLTTACTQLPAATPRYKKIILVVLESFSAYQSRYFSALNDWTPELDRLAQKGWAFTSFNANGFNTTGGLSALLTGDVPIQPPAGMVGSTQPHILKLAPADGQKSLLSLMAASNWTTYFATSGDTSFAGKKEWLKGIGFDQVEGTEHPAYEGHRKYVFNSAADEHLYARSIAISQQLRRPWFLVLETVSTHPPYRAPGFTGSSLEKSVRYADAQLATFVSNLEATNFFQDGLLIITSDHRSMTRLTRPEYSRREYGAESWIPLVLYSPRMQGRQPQIAEFQQTDLYNSLRGLVTRRSCTTPVRGDIWSQQIAQCITYVPAGNRNQLLARCNNNTAFIALNGREVLPLYGASVPAWLSAQINYWRSRPPRL